MIKPQLIGHGIYDVLSGYRNYWFTEPHYEEDIYRTLVTINTNENATQWNDAWKQYQATHKGTLGLGLAYSWGKFALSMATITGSAKSYTPKRQQLSAKAKRNIAGETSSFADEMVDMTTHNINLIHTPETKSQGNEFTNDLVSKSINRIMYTQVVEDIDAVARELEGYGYRVHEEYSTENLFTLLNTRYYYNIIKCSNIELYLDILNSNDVIENIKERFLNGLRIWNRGAITSPYLYDNVEKAYL